MADVSVEFGAKDTGLEATLKTVQAEISRLETEVNSGTLSFEEIAKKMREIKQSQGIFTQLGGEVESASTSVQKLKEQMRLAESITKANRTAIEVYSDTVDELQKHLDAGTISQKTYASAIEKAESALKAATPQTEEAKQANRELEEALKKAEQETRSLSEEQKKAEAITKSNRSATQIYNDEVSELHKHLTEGRISMETFATAVAKADAKLSASAPQIGKDALEMGDDVKKGSDKGGLSLGELGIAAGIAGVAVKAGMALAEAAMNGVRAVAAGFGDAIDLGGRLTDLSSQTGESAGNLLVLERAFTNTGVSAEAVGSTISKLQKFMSDAAQGGVAQSESMRQLGLTMGDLAGKTPTEQMAVFAKQISGIQDPAQRAVAAMGIFGEEGVKLLPMLNDFSDEIEGAKDQLGGLPGVMDRSAAAFDGVGDSMAAINSKVMEFAAGFLEDALPALTTFTNALSGIDAAGWGQAAMNEITKIADTLIGAFKDPLGAIMAWGTAYEAGYKTLANGLLNAGVTFIDFVANALQTQLPSAIGSFITQGFIDSALTFSRYLTEALMTFSTALSDLPGFEAIGQKMLTTLGGVNNSIIAEQLANMGKTEAAAARVVEEFGKAAEKTTVSKEDFFGAEEATKRMNEEFAKLQESGKTTRENFETSATNAGIADKKIINATNNSAILTGNFGKAATNAAAAQTATENAQKAAAKLETSFAAAMGSAYTYETSTLGAEAALARGAREMTSEQFNEGFKEVRTNLRDLGGEYKDLANSGAGIKTIAESLGLDTDDKSPKRLLLEVQQELEKIANTEVVIGITFNEEAFNASITSLYDSANATFANPIEANVEGDKSINAVRASASEIWGTPVDLNFEGTQTIQDLRDDAETNFSGPFTVSMSGSQAANDVFNTVSSAFDAPVAVGVDADLTTATPEVAALGDPQTFTLSADTAQAEAAITSAVGSLNSNVTTQTDDNNIASTRATIEQGVAGIPLTFTVDPEQIQKSIGTIDVTGEAGGGVLSSIETLVSTIQGYVETIKDRLPMTALA